ncbi:hypothetical protein [Histidinibacterium lentulum]|uniref:Uncharacterized protein n=1 Tax=Histidinibacterium lentulum TaxID=2480588 RepID=A0A3N2QRE4_9RHOB|nr:hypothetical protein [Histidinibacterium lentulum]ROT97751.1 hypothetical protein EAT49_18270 [Histidinibacterium lentulum]
MPSTDAFEGRLLAQRKILARLLTHLGDAELRAFLEERSQLSAHEEDPGSDPDPAYALESALAEEMQAILAEWDRLRDA